MSDSGLLCNIFLILLDEIILLIYLAAVNLFVKLDDKK